MEATGTLYISKTRPLATTAADGAFQLQLFAVDRIDVHMAERWVLMLKGAAARAFWEEHHTRLVPGAGIQVTTDRMRSFMLRGCAPEIHARAKRIELAPGNPATNGGQNQSPNQTTNLQEEAC